MAQLMAQGGEMVDGWVKHCKDTNATTPELIAMLMINNETAPNKAGVLAILAASAIQRLAVAEIDFDGEERP